MQKCQRLILLVISQKRPANQHLEIQSSTSPGRFPHSWEVICSQNRLKFSKILIFIWLLKFSNLKQPLLFVFLDLSNSLHSCYRKPAETPSIKRMILHYLGFPSGAARREKGSQCRLQPPRTDVIPELRSLQQERLVTTSSFGTQIVRRAMPRAFAGQRILFSLCSPIICPQRTTSAVWCRRPKDPTKEEKNTGLEIRLCGRVLAQHKERPGSDLQSAQN